MGFEFTYAATSIVPLARWQGMADMQYPGVGGLASGHQGPCGSLRRVHLCTAKTRCINAPYISHIQIAHAERVALNKVAARFDFIAHQRNEDFIGGNGVFDLHFE